MIDLTFIKANTINIIFLSLAFVGLLGIYPLSYWAYQKFAEGARKKGLKDDFGLLGLVPEDELEETVNTLYDTAYAPKQFLIYISLIVFVSLLLLGAFLARNQLEFTEPERLSLVFYSFLGAYAFSVQLLIRRYNTFDLQPQVYSSILTRMLVAAVITFVGASVIEFAGGDLATTNVTGEDAPKAWAAVLAFIIGYFPDRGIRWFIWQTNRTLNQSDDAANALSLKRILGISTWHEARLIEMGIDDVQNLATVDIGKMLLSTRFDTQEIIHWIDQAILLTKVRDKYDRYKSANINTFHEYRSRYNKMFPLTNGQALPTSEAAKKLEEERKTFATVLGLTGPDELGALADYSSYPNYAHIAEYYLRTGEVARQRASSAMKGVLKNAKREQDYLRAIEDYERRLRHNLNDAEAKANLAVAYYAVGRFEDALTCVTEAIKTIEANASRATFLESELAKAYANRADIYIRQQKFHEATQDCSKALNLDKLGAETYNYRGLAYLNLGETENALADFNHALQLDDRFPQAYLNRGYALNREGKFQEAVSDFERAHLLGNRSNYELWFGWGTALLGTQQYDDAIHKLSMAIVYGAEGSKIVAPAYSKRGFAYSSLDNYSKAQCDFESALKKDDNLLEALDGLGLLKAKQGQLSEAIKHYKAVLSQDEGRYVTRYNLALAYYKDKQYRETKAHLEKILETAPSTSFEAAAAREGLSKFAPAA
jgi:tetratricopeptide (TPR) repeat protein